MTSLLVASAALLAVSSSVAAAPRNSESDWRDGRLPASVAQGVPHSGGTLVVRLDQEPPSLDGITDSALSIVWMLERKVMESMAELDAGRHPDYPLKPALATSWEVSEDQLTFTFHLRKDVVWHDGAPFTGKDVVATVKKILDPGVRALHLRNNFVDLADITTVPGDDFTVVARYRKPYFLAFRALATLPIHPGHLLAEAGDMLHAPLHRAPVGTGPFRFEEWKSGDRISFVRNEKYWGRKAWLDRVVYRVVSDPQVAFQLLKRGEFDVYVQLQPQQWLRDLEAAGLKGKVHRIRFFNPNYNFIAWRTRASAPSRCAGRSSSVWTGRRRAISTRSPRRAIRRWRRGPTTPRGRKGSSTRLAGATTTATASATRTACRCASPSS